MMKEQLDIFFQNPFSYIFGIILLGFYFFLKRKLENLADKEDVDGITRKVESVKKEFNEDLETLKAELEVLKSNRISLIQEKKKAIYDFWTAVNSYFCKLDYYLSAQIKSNVEKKEYLLKLDNKFDLLSEKASMFNLVLYEEIDDETDGIILELFDVFHDMEQLIRKTIVLLVGCHNEEGKIKNNDVLIEIYKNATNSKNVLNQKYSILLDKLKYSIRLILDKTNQIK
ncbi:hypothetical protein LG651_04890 [Tamlana sp. 62-3]|uniref:Uncharacterized protein n=1 Tax=Neotamlana sargassicola TaxID=2883125 RepID=A0A9X1L3W4_9FLAO|nr:hypothetical protein [Tamlana sargassicola]MCB4807577.1 hypothetical protein [Tamlana sargassicola]